MGGRRRRCAVLAAVHGAILSSTALGAINASWVAPVSDSWSDPTAWSTNPVFPNIDQPDPGDLYNVTIGASGTAYTVTLDTGVTISRLLISSNSATFEQTSGTALQLVDGGLNVSAGTYQMDGGTLLSDDPMNISSSFVWNGGAIGGFGAVNLSGSTSTTPGIFTHTLSTTMNNTGVINHGGAPITLNNGTLNNLVGATLNISTPSPFASGGGSNLLTNSGLINILSSFGTATTSMTIPFLDTGTIALSGGTLLFNNFGSTTFGAGAVITGSGTADLDGGTTTLAGTTTFNVANTQLNGGTINGSGDLQINDLFTWNSGTMSGSGVTHVAHNAEIDLGKSSSQRGLQRTINNDGVVNLSNGQLSMTNGTFNNLTDGVVLITGNTPFFLNGSTTSFVNNAGLINVNAASFGFATLSTMTDSGTINAAGGTTTFAGTFNYETGATLTGPGTIDLGTSSSHIVNGTLTLAGSNMKIGGGSITGNGNIVLTGALTWNAGTLGDGGTFGLGGIATLLIQSGGALNVANSGVHTLGRNISNAGVINLQGASISINNSTLNNLPGGTINITAVSNPFGFVITNGIIRNSGVINFDQGTVSGTGVLGMNLINTATINLLSGTLNLGGGSTNNGISVVNSGTINNLGGTLQLGQGIQMPGAFVGGAGFIDLAGPLAQTTDTLDGTLTASGPNLNFNAGTIAGPGNLLIRGNFNWNGGTLAGSGIVDINSTSTMNVGNSGQLNKTLSRTINNSGVLNITQGTISLSNGMLNNLPGGTINLTGVNTSGVFTNFGVGSNNLISNAGQINVNGGTSNLTLFNSGTSVLFNTGTINVPAGTLILGGGTHGTGAVITGAGYVELTSINSGTVTLNDAFALNGSNVHLHGALTGPGNLNVNNVFNWDSGSVGGTGVVNIAPGATMNEQPNAGGLGRIVNNFGTWNIDQVTFGSLTVSTTGGGINNTVGGVINVGSTIFAGSSASVVTNDGLMNVDNIVTIMTPSFVDSGTINVTGGSLSFGSLTTFESGAFVTGAGTVFLGSFSSGSINVNGTTTLAASAIQMFNGFLSGPGDLNLTSSFSWSGGSIVGPGALNVAGGATFNISGLSHTLARTVNNSGNLILTASNVSLSGGTINNTTNGTINAGTIGSTVNIQFAGNVNRVVNAGTFNVPGGTVDVGVPFSNTGTLVVGGGGNVASANFTDQVSQIIGSTLLRGTYIVHDLSSLALGTGSITTNGANVTLDGPGAQFPTIDAIANNSGTFAVTGGQVFVTSASYTNTGTTVVGHGSTLHIVGTLNSTGTLNIQGSLIVDGSSPAAILDQIVSGRAGGAWNGVGINSSAAAANPQTALGFAPASSLGASAAAAFDSQPVDGSSIIVKYTEIGDANLDDTVNALDFNALASHFGESNAMWSDSDFNYDGQVDTQDFVALAGNLGGTMASTPSPDLSLGALVPEPGACGIAAGLVLLARRRKR